MSDFRVSLAQQIEEVQHHLNLARRSREATNTAAGRMHVARLGAVLETLKTIQRHEPAVRAVIRHAIQRERENAAHGVSGSAAQ